MTGAFWKGLARLPIALCVGRLHCALQSTGHIRQQRDISYGKETRYLPALTWVCPHRRNTFFFLRPIARQYHHWIETRPCLERQPLHSYSLGLKKFPANLKFSKFEFFCRALRLMFPYFPRLFLDHHEIVCRFFPIALRHVPRCICCIKNEVLWVSLLCQLIISKWYEIWS